jgi:hypothetical protein
MAKVLTKKNPVWLSKQCEFDTSLKPHVRRSVRYYKQLYLAFPEWADGDERIRKLYKERDARNKKVTDGNRWTVDHIVPIKSDIVCGLHCFDNMQLLREDDNLRKSNTWWPNMPFEIEDMLPEFEPYQMSLI